MKICQITNVSFMYEKFLKSLVHKLSIRGHDVYVVLNNSEEKLTFTEKNVKFINKSITRRKSIILYIKSIFELVKFFNKHEFDLINVHTPSASIQVRIAALIANKKNIIYTAHGFYFHDRMPKLERLLHFYLEYYLSKCTKAIMMQSYEDYKTAKEFKFKKENELYCIYNGVNNKVYKPPSPLERKEARIKYNITDKSIVISIVARLVEEKGHIELFNAIYKILKEENKNIKLIITGSFLKSEHGKGINNSLLMLKNIYPDKIVLTGYLSNTLDIYHASDIFCLPSWREGMPRTIIEAMMCSLPVVTTNIRGCREIVDNNKTGIIVEPKKHIQLKLALEELIQNQNKRIQYGKSGYRKAIKYYSEDKYIKRQVKILEDIKSTIN